MLFTIAVPGYITGWMYFTVMQPSGSTYWTV